MRQIVEDAGSAPTVNLAAMPNFNYQNATANVPFDNAYMWIMGSAAPTFTTAYDTTDLDPGGISTAALSHTVTSVQTTSPSNFERAYNLFQPKWVAAGDVVRWAFWIKAPAAFILQPYWEGVKSDGTTYASSTQAGNVPATVSVAANTWTRIVATHTISATANGWTIRRCGWLTNGYTTVVGEVWKLGACTITVNQPLPAYDVSGDTPGWVWQGTAGGSSSSGWPLPVTSVVNLFRNPQCAVDVSGYKVVSTAGGPGGNFSASRIATGGPSGGSFYRVVWNTTSSVGAVTNADLLFFGDQTWADSQQVNRAVCSVQPGQTYAGTVWVRCSRAIQACVQLQMLTNSAGALGTNQSSNVTLVPNVWTQLSTTATAGANATAIRIDVDVTSSNLVWNAGDTFDVTMVSLTATPTAYPFADGSLPNWNWAGKPGQSMSFGPAYTLANITGAPLAAATVPGLVSIAADDPEPTAGFSLYAVYAALDNTVSSDTAIATAMATVGEARHDGVSVVGTAEIRTQIGTGSVNNYYRLFQSDGSSGYVEQVFNSLNGRAIGKHVAASLVSSNGAYRHLVDGQIVVSGSMNNYTSGIKLLNLDLGDTNSRTAPIASYVWRGPQDDWTAARVSGWLARQYGGPLPLEEIAGVPLLAQATGGSTVALPLANIGSLQGRTLYIVHDITSAEVADTTTYPNVGIWRDAAGVSLGQLEITHAGPQNGMQARVDTMAGTNFNGRLSNVRTVGRHVAAASVNDGLTQGTLDFDSSSTTFSVTPGSGMPFNNAVISPTADVVFVAAYGQAHDAATRKKVLAWLARKYGATPPSGY